jgi:hypothetical protein
MPSAPPHLFISRDAHEHLQDFGEPRSLITALHTQARPFYLAFCCFAALRFNPAAMHPHYTRKSSTCAIKSWLMRRYKSLPEYTL